MEAVLSEDDDPVDSATVATDGVHHILYTHIIHIEITTYIIIFNVVIFQTLMFD